MVVVPLQRNQGNLALLIIPVIVPMTLIVNLAEMKEVSQRRK